MSSKPAGVTSYAPAQLAGDVRELIAERGGEDGGGCACGASRRCAGRLSTRPGGRFTSADIDGYVEAWSQPGALAAMLGYYRAMIRARRDVSPRISRP